MKRPATRRSPGQSQSRLDRFLIATVALTILLRLLVIIQLRGTPYSTMSPQFVDSWYYHRWAIDITRNWIGTDVFFLRPIYPYLLALVYRLFGVRVIAVQLLQLVMAGVSCALLFNTTRRLFDRRAAAWAGFGFALCGVLAAYTPALLYVELTILLTLVVIWLVEVDSARPWVRALTGLAYGLLVLCRPEFLLLLPVLTIWLLRRHERPAAVVLFATISIATVAVVPTRNWLVARDAVLFTAHSGVNFYYGNNPNADGTWQPVPELDQGLGFSHERLKQASRTVDGKQLGWSTASSHWLQRGLQFVTRSPLAWLRLLGRKLLLLLADYEVPNDYYPELARAWSPVIRLMPVGFGLALALGSLGLVWSWPQRRRLVPVTGAIAVHLASALAFYVLSRLRAPLIPVLLIPAGYAAAQLAELVRQRRWPRLAAGSTVAASILVGSLLLAPVSRADYSAQAWTQAGNTYAEIRQPGRAAAAFRRALKANPAHSAARYGLILTLATAGRADEATPEYQRLLTASPGSRFERLAAARLAIARRDFAAARGGYLELLAADPGDAETAYLLGLVYISIDSLEPAWHWLARAAADPNHDAARAALGQVEAQLARRR
jgi:tetratricopeptide (TPR) repeat protein